GPAVQGLAGVPVLRLACSRSSQRRPSEQRPWHRRHVAARGGEAPVGPQTVAPLGERSELLGAEQVLKPPSELAVQLVEDTGDALQLLSIQRLAQPPPQDGAQLVLVMEGEPVVHAEAVP